MPLEKVSELFSPRNRTMVDTILWPMLVEL